MGSLSYGPSDSATDMSDSETDASNPYGGYRGSSSSSSSGWKGSKASKATSKGGAGLSAAGQKMIEGVRQEAMSDMDRQAPVNLPSYRKGGKVRRTGLARLHKGEKVIPRGKVKKVERQMKKKSRRKAGREM